MEWIRFVIVAILMAIGLSIKVIEVIGVYKFKYVINRMHSAAMGDTLGLMSCLLALVLLTGFSFTTVKLIFLIVCFWVSGPVSSHLISRLEITTNSGLEKFFKRREIK